MSFALLSLSIFNKVTNLIDSVVLFTRKIYRAVESISASETYLFLHGIDTPCLEKNVNVYSTSIAKPLWRYIPETRQFLQWQPNGTTTVQNAAGSHPLPVLSIEILDGDRVLYDLSDFIELVRVYNSGEEVDSPTLAHIYNAWTLSSHLVLDPTRDFKVRFLTEMAETFVVSLTEMDNVEAYDDPDMPPLIPISLPCTPPIELEQYIESKDD
jgi:hypothetical protein